MFSQGEQSCGYEIKHSLIEMYVNSSSQLDTMLKKGTVEGGWSQNNKNLTTIITTDSNTITQENNINKYIYRSNANN